MAEMLRVEVPGEGYHQRLVSCQQACPVRTDARGYVRAIADGDYASAYLIARGPNPFASICGRICGAPCEAACRRGKLPRVDDDGVLVSNDRPIAIRALKRFACDRFGPEARLPTEVLSDLQGHVPRVGADAEEMAALLRGALEGRFRKAEGQRVAIIGAGPAGLAAAHDLALLGFRPLVFETEAVAAGMLAVGVPAYRLPRELIRREVAVIEALGVEIRCGVTIGKDVSFADLRRNFAAILVAVGAKASRSLGLPGERGPGVLGGVDLLRAVSLGERVDLGKQAVVVGGGNVAYDVARSVLRQIAYDTARVARRVAGMGLVTLASLETLEEMPADTVEIREGDEEGIVRMNGWGPVAVARDAQGAVVGMTFKRCLRVYDDTRRFAPIFDENELVTVPCDTVLLAVGQSPNLTFLEEGGKDVEQFRPGWPKLDKDTLMTTAPGVFAAGDLAHGTRLLIEAVASGKSAARSIYHHITGRTLTPDATHAHLTLDRYRREPGFERIRRVEIPTLEADQRLAHPETVVETGYDEAHAKREASRCLDCGVTPVFDGQRCVLCGGCADVCPTQCLKLVSLAEVALDTPLAEELAPEESSAILKDEDRCIRCALCVMRCPADAIDMERVTFETLWRTPA
jgi:NADPH-dependent glutamate synthase beta subunit-like oxidoreductase